ncbi:MAG: large conductance mechanosensitive channel protein MscL [Sphingomonadales bacterium]
MGMVSEFKAFINRGNVLDLAVGVIIGAAFGKIVTALTEDFINPVLSLATGGIDFANMYVPIATVPNGTPETLAGMKAAGVPVFAYGHFITEIINFLILAWIIFMIVRTANKVLKRTDEAATPADILLLREIRDELKARPKV